MKRMLSVGILIVIAGLLVLPHVVLTQGIAGRVMNRRTRAVFTGATALSDAFLNAAPGDVLLAAGTLTEAVDIITSGFTGTLVGETRAAWRPNISVQVCTNAVLDVSDRGGALTIIGVNVRIPDLCAGLFSDGAVSGGTPLTVRGSTFVGTASTNVITGIDILDEFDGPFNFNGNTITGILDGIRFDADAVQTVTALINGNKVTDRTVGVGAVGIQIQEVLMGSAVTVERNTVNGSGGGGIGINIANSDGVIVQRNTVINYSDPAPGTGIAVANAPNTQIIRNKVQNNEVDIDVDAGGGSSAGTVVNFNNILGTPASQTGLLFGDATTNLNATNNWWGAASGPGSVNAPPTCPENTGTSCTGPGGGGTGMRVDAFGSPDCGTVNFSVHVCPVSKFSNSAGA
jgi:hypothetical protein